MGDIKLTYGRCPKGKKLAVISRGGHPQILGSGEAEVLDVKECKTKAIAKAWFKDMLEQRPWETRQ